MAKCSRKLSPEGQQMVEDNLALVGWQVKKLTGPIRRSGLSWDDAFQAGCLALCRSVSGLDLGRSKLSTYAAISVRREIADACAEHTGLSISANARRRNPEVVVSTLSLEAPSKGAEGLSIGDNIAGDMDVEDSLFAQAIWALLTPKEQHIISLLSAGYSQLEIGKLYGVTSERIRQQKVRAQVKVRAYLAAADHDERRVRQREAVGC